MAGEPITARIRRRCEARTNSGQPDENDAAPVTAELLPPAAAESSLIRPSMSFRERIAMDRERRDEGPILP